MHREAWAWRLATCCTQAGPDDDRFLIVAQTKSDEGDHRKLDDVVVWLPVSHNKEIIPNGVDSRSSMTGLFVGKVTPESNLVHLNFNFTGKYWALATERKFRVLSYVLDFSDST